MYRARSFFTSRIHFNKKKCSTLNLNPYTSESKNKKFHRLKHGCILPDFEMLGVSNHWVREMEGGGDMGLEGEKKEKCNTQKAFRKPLNIVNAMDVYGYIRHHEYWLHSNVKCQPNGENSFRFMTRASSRMNTVSIQN